MPVTVADVTSYLGEDRGSWSDDELQEALDAESADQAARVTYPVDADGDPVAAPNLDEALKRRVARNLAMRRLPLAVLQGDADAGSTTLPGSDPEVRRLEAPYRKRSALIG